MIDSPKFGYKYNLVTYNHTPTITDLDTLYIMLSVLMYSQILISYSQLIQEPTTKHVVTFYISAEKKAGYI